MCILFTALLKERTQPQYPVETYQLKAAGSPRIQDLLPDNLCGHMFGRVVNLSLKKGYSHYYATKGLETDDGLLLKALP